MREILLHWYRPPGESKINLGDEVNANIVEFISGRAVRQADLLTCELVAIGSVLQALHNRLAKRSLPVDVWGSGLMTPQSRRFGPEVHFHAVRGPLTRCMAGVSPSLPMGDPGILASEIWPAARHKTYSFGLVPHQSQVNDPVWMSLQAATPSSVIVDLTSTNIDETFGILGQCEVILSTSLHGLIFADAYGIPNVWAAYRDIHPADAFKFYDYFSSIGRTQFRRWNLLSSEKNLNKMPPEFIETSHLVNVSDYKKRIAASFPSHLKN